MDTQLREIQQELGSAVEGMTSEELRWRPEGKWCAAEVLEHLYLTYTGTTRGFQKVLEAGKPLITRAGFRKRSRKWFVLGLGYLPSGRKAPPNTRPKGLEAEKVRAEFGEKIAAMDAAIAECEARFGRRTLLLDHPVLGPLTARQWRKFHRLHGLLHRRQLVRLREGLRRLKSQDERN